MLATLILGFAAGAGAAFAELHVKRGLDVVFPVETPMTDVDLRVFSFTACLLAAAILAWIFGNGSGFILAVGAALGVFWPKILQRIQGLRTPDYGDDV